MSCELSSAAREILIYLLGVNPPACQPLSNLWLLAKNGNTQSLHGSGLLGCVLACSGLQKLAIVQCPLLVVFTSSGCRCFKLVVPDSYHLLNLTKSITRCFFTCRVWCKATSSLYFIHCLHSLCVLRS